MVLTVPSVASPVVTVITTSLVGSASKTTVKSSVVPVSLVAELPPLSTTVKPAASSSVIFAVADAVVIVTSPLLALLIFAITVSIVSEITSSVTGIVIVPVVDPSATDICAAAAIAV